VYTILVINPGSTSTRVSLFEGEKEVKRETIKYSRESLNSYRRIIEQLSKRREDIEKVIGEWELKKVDGVVGRGGLFKPLESGTYYVNEKMIEDIKEGRVQGEHISNIGAVLAFEIAKEFNVPSFIVDPVSVDEFEPCARISGIPEIERVALQHTLNIKAVARNAAKDKGKKLNELNLVVAHLGGGISVCPIEKGRIIDANNAIQEGPFSPERSGTLPTNSLLSLCFSGKYSKEWLKKRLVGQGGLVAYLGTNSIEEVEKRIEKGDKFAELIYKAMAYQVSKEIGGMATVLNGDIDFIILTGGGAYSKLLVSLIEERVSFIAKVLIYPGENEMKSLALGALRVLKKEEKGKVYR
jgi:butyrate kinase